MQRAVLNRATIPVADRTDVSGRVTASSINDGSCAKREGTLWRICGSTIFGCVVSVAVLASLAPMPAQAQVGTSGTVLNRISALETEVAALQSAVATLQTSNSALQNQVNSLQTQLSAVQNNKALLLGPFVSVNPFGTLDNGVTGPNIYFTGANIHIVSGSNATDDNLSHGGTLTGLGNLIIGYDEDAVPQGGPPPNGAAHTTW